MKKINKTNKVRTDKIASFKRILTYPEQGKVKFQVSLDKNGQVYEIRRCNTTIIRNPETKKRYMKITLGERPRLLFERIKGRPFIIATPWIDDFIQSLENENVE